jgi:uroporphyrinogen-III synthase
LEHYGQKPALVPERFEAEAFAGALIEDANRRGELLTGKRILLARAARGRDVLPARLKEVGAHVDDVAVYRNVPVAGNDARGQEALFMLREQQLDVLTFTSSSTVRNFAQWLLETDDTGKGLGLVTDNPRLHVACIGPVTASTAREVGLPVHIEAQLSTIDGLIEAIIQYEKNMAAKFS